MGRKKKRKSVTGEGWEDGNHNSEYYVAFYDAMFKSDAWRSLSLQARAVYFVLKASYKGPKENPERVVMAQQRYIHEYTGVSGRLVTDYLLELQEFGFIEMIQRHGKREPQRVKLTGAWIGMNGERLQRAIEIQKQRERGRKKWRL